ncbi:MAG: Lrp/AsnC family transcriptional regulator [Devosia sp.]
MTRKARDTIDRNIIGFLEDDARISATELGRRLGIARSTVNERIARLERDGVILGYAAIINRRSQRPPTSALLHLVCDRARCGQIVDALRNLPEIRHCYSVAGPYGLTCMVETPTAEDLDALMEEVALIRGVKTVDCTLILSTKLSRGIEAPAPYAPPLVVVK